LVFGKLKFFIIAQHIFFVVNSDTDIYGEPTSSYEKGVAYISGVTFGPRKVEYEIINGLAVFEGDIILGKAEELEKNPGSPRAAAVVGQRFRWPSGVVPFTIDPNFPNPSRLDDPINYFHNNTAIRFVTHTNEANFVIFHRGGNDVCGAFVGMQGYSPQYIFLADGCGTKEIKHEITHTLGLFHEQSRADRNLFVRINYENVEPGKESQFNQYVTEQGEDLGEYDYCSIMHYSANLFSKNGQPTITVLQPGRPCASTIGQTSVLSEGDKYAIRYMYVPTTVPDVLDFGVNPAVQRVIRAELEVKLVNIDSLAEGRSLLAGSWVSSQDPNGGTNVPRGTFVTLYWTNRPRPLQERDHRLTEVKN
jgi:hypothetical protein